MIRSANHSSFPKVGETPLDQQLRAVLHRREQGRATDDDVREAVDVAIGISVAEQSRAFIDVVTEGMIAWDGPLSHVATCLDGMRTAELFRWFHTNFLDARPEVVGAISRPGPFLEREYLVADDVSAAKPVKTVLPGPVTLARSARDLHYGDRAALAGALAAAFAEEVAHLASIGARVFQIDEPLLCCHPEDIELVSRTAQTIFDAAGPEATTVLSTYYGDLAALADRLGELPGTHLGLDLVWSDRNDALIEGLPAERGVALGVFDAGTSLAEDAADVAARLEPLRESLQRRDVIVGPNAGLEQLSRDNAFDKLLQARYLTERLSEEWRWA